MENARVTTPPADGLRRSRRVRQLSPQPLPQIEGGGGGTAIQKKRARQQDEEEESPKEVSHGGDANAGGQVNWNVNASLTDVPEAEEHEIGDNTSELGEASVSSLVLGSTSSSSGGSGVRASENSVEEQEAHPSLFIDAILNVVFKHIINQPGPRIGMARDVRNIRLVCKKWKTFITRLYRQTRPATVFDRYDQRGSDADWLRLITLTKFMKTMKSSQLIPMQRYTFRRPTFDPKNLKMFREFLRICGPDAVVLSMAIDCSYAEKIMLNLRNLPILKMEKLHTLALQTDTNKHHLDDFAELLKLLDLLLIAANNLHVLKVDYYNPYEDSERFRHHDDVVAQQLSLLIARRMSKSVKNLELKVKMNEAALNNLVEMQAKPEMIALCVPPGLEPRIMYTFLERHASTLKDLRFWADNDKCRHLVELPQLGELVNLQLPDSTVSVTIPSHFAETFPKLHSLKMSCESTISTLLSTVKKPSKYLKVLDMASWGFSCPASLVKKVAQSFPCLVELCIGVQEDHKETMEEVFKYLDGLESLHISFSDFNQTAIWMDSLLSGIPEADCNRISMLQDLDTVTSSGVNPQWSISRLRTLEMEQYFGHNLVGFTDVSAHSVFLEMNNLREIIITNTPKKLSPRYLELLRDKLVIRHPDPEIITL